nr:hypothetical protein CDL15_Pgr001607 [Ipomoea batatas]
MVPTNSLFLCIPGKKFFFSRFLALNWLNTWQRTKVLEISMPFTPLSTLKIDSPLNCRTSRMDIWYRAWASRFLHIMFVISGSVLPTCSLSMSSFVGFSVTKANAPKVSMMRLTQKSFITERGTSPVDTATTKLITRSTTLTKHLPHFKAVATDAKLSSKMTMSELSLATSVPWIPMDSPMSASFRAEVSFVPMCHLLHCTISSLSKGEDLAITRMFSTRSIRCSSVRFLNSNPSMTDPSSGAWLGCRMPHSVAIAFAVKTLSPVIILMFTPANWHDSTAFFTPSLQGSFRPASPRKVRPSSATETCVFDTCLCAKAMHLRLLAAMPWIICSNFALSLPSRDFLFPSRS